MSRRLRLRPADTHPADELVRRQVDAGDGVAEHVAGPAVGGLEEHAQAAAPGLSGQRVRLVRPGAGHASQPDFHGVQLLCGTCVAGVAQR